MLGVARADLLERTRTFALLVVVAALLELGYLFVPDRAATYSTLDLGGWRGLYDSAWMGASTAILTVSFLPLLGFFLIRPAQSRDAALGTYDLVISAPVSRTLVGLGKWTSNVTLLVAFACLLALAAIAMQLVRGEDLSIHLLAYALPLVVVTVPACAMTASLALGVVSVPGLRGIGGGVVWFFLWTALLVVPLQTGGDYETGFDPLGMTALTDALVRGLVAIVPHANRAHDISIGISDAATHVFRFPGIRWRVSTLAARASWLCVAVALACAVAPFAVVREKPRGRGRFDDVAPRLAMRLPLPMLVRAELAAVLGGAGPLWAIGALLIAVSALLTPAEGIARIVAPLAWIWPIGPMSFAIVMDVRAGCEDVLRATPTSALRRACARTTTCFAIALVPIAVLAARDGPAGIALLAVACAIAALAVASGALARSALPFQGVALLVWYLGPVNRFPPLDPANAVTHAPATLAACAIATSIALAVAALRLR